MSLFRSMGLSASGMTVERFRMDTTANNMANTNTVTNQPGGTPFYRKMVEVQGGPDGVRIVGLVDDVNSVETQVLPEQPGVDGRGTVFKTQINPVNEMVDMMSATRAYEANVKAFNAAKGMAKSALEIGKV